MLEFGQEFGMPPWEVEEQMTQEWLDRWVLYRNERAKADIRAVGK